MLPKAGKPKTRHVAPHVGGHLRQCMTDLRHQQPPHDTSIDWRDTCCRLIPAVFRGLVLGWYRVEENPWNRCDSKGCRSYPLRESN